MGDHTLQVTGGLAELGLRMDQVKVGEIPVELYSKHGENAYI